LSALLLAGLALWVTCHNPNVTEQESGVASAEEPTIPVAGDLSRIQVAASRRGPVQLVDKLTDSHLDLSVTLVGAEKRESIIKSGEEYDLSADLAEGQLKYDLLSGGLIQRLPLKSVAQWLNEKWILRLPYNACVSVTLHSAVLSTESPPGNFMLLPDFGLFLEAYGQGAPPGIPAFPVMNMTFGGKAQWFYASGSLKPIGVVNSPMQNKATILHPASGPHIVGWINGFGDSAFAPIELLPGESIDLDLYVRLRPVMRGVLLDWRGDPVPHAPVSFVTSLDLVDYDYLPQDPHAMVTYEREGTYYRTVKKTYETDENGNFEYRVPRGQGYALWSHALGGYCYWSTYQSAIPFSEAEKIILQLQEPTLENTTVFQILWPNGEPFTNGKVTVTTAGDVPFFRQWPYKIPLNERGEVQLVGIEPDLLIAVRVFLDGEDWQNPFYAAPYLNVPDKRRVEVQLPEDAVRKKNL
jgi:hypothetical protein